MGSFGGVAPSLGGFGADVGHGGSSPPETWLCGDAVVESHAGKGKALWRRCRGLGLGVRPGPRCAVVADRAGQSARLYQEGVVHVTGEERVPPAGSIVERFLSGATFASSCSAQTRVSVLQTGRVRLGPTWSLGIRCWIWFWSGGLVVAPWLPLSRVGSKPYAIPRLGSVRLGGARVRLF
jgi:hypothetical protein